MARLIVAEGVGVALFEAASSDDAAAATAAASPPVARGKAGSLCERRMPEKDKDDIEVAFHSGGKRSSEADDDGPTTAPRARNGSVAGGIAVAFSAAAVVPIADDDENDAATLLCGGANVSSASVARGFFSRAFWKAEGARAPPSDMG